jgi:hypothetical protein
VSAPGKLGGQHGAVAAMRAPAEETVRHVELLREGLPGGFSTPLWAAQDKRSRYVRHPSAASGLQGDAYVCVSVLRYEDAQKLGKHRRVSNENATGLVGLTIDFDVVGTPDGKGGVKKAGAPSVEAAITA